MSARGAEKRAGAAPSPRQSGDAAREADHRIANELAMLAASMRLKLRDFDLAESEGRPQDPRLVLRGVLASLESVSRLHRLLAIEGGEAGVDLADHLRRLCAPFTDMTAGPMVFVELGTGMRVFERQAQSIGRIVIEAITNAVKHAGGAGSVAVRASSGAAGAVIEVSDDGDGLPDRFDGENAGGFGFRLMRSLAADLGARLEFASGPPGLTVRLILPAAG